MLPEVINHFSKIAYQLLVCGLFKHSNVLKVALLCLVCGFKVEHTQCKTVVTKLQRTMEKS